MKGKTKQWLTQESYQLNKSLSHQTNSSRTQTWLNSPKKLLYMCNVLLTDREITRHEREESHKESFFTFKQEADTDPKDFWALSQNHWFLSELKTRLSGFDLLPTFMHHLKLNLATSITKCYKEPHVWYSTYTQNISTEGNYINKSYLISEAQHRKLWLWEFEGAILRNISETCKIFGILMDVFTYP